MGGIDGTTTGFTVVVGSGVGAAVGNCVGVPGTGTITGLVSGASVVTGN